MSRILAQIEAKRHSIHPDSSVEFLALQIAFALDDEAHAADYILLSRRYTVAALLSAYRSAKAHCPAGWPRLDHFRATLTEEHHAAPVPKLGLISFRIERRHINIAFFDGFKLDFTSVRNLPRTPGLAERSIARFAAWALAEFPGASVALELVEGGIRSVRKDRAAALSSFIADQNIPLWQVKRSDLFTAAARPQPVTRSQFRAHAERIFPDLAVRFTTRGIMDAGLLGLFVQCRRLLDLEVSDKSK